MKRRGKRKYLEYFIVLNILCGCFLYLVYFGATDLENQLSSKSSDDEYLISHNGRKGRLFTNWTRILFWTGYFGKYNLNAYGIDQDTFRNCPVKCQFTFDKKLLTLSDAVIFHVRDIASVGLPQDHPQHQRWIFWLIESTSNTRLDLKPFNNVFNWTMTYRSDSDIYHPYGKTIEKTVFEITKNYEKLVNIPFSSNALKLINRPKLVAWVVSNCFTHSNRESFVKEIEKYMKIDIFGECGQYSCLYNTSNECYDQISKEYKFYFAFENSLCVEYVTEKFFDALKYDIVPIVYGRANYTNLGPPGSFIDVRDFPNPQSLANYLVYLNKNPQEYLQYFKWKDKYKIIPSDGWCSLCTKLKSNEKYGSKTYSNIYKWWHEISSEQKLFNDGSHTKMNEIMDSNSEKEINSACLPIPEFSIESWFSKIRKKYFILP